MERVLIQNITQSPAPELPPGKDDGHDSFKIASPILLWLLVFGLSASVHYKDILKHLRSKGIIIGLTGQFIVLPLVGFALVSCFPTLPDYIASMIIILTSSPGGSYSNLVNSLFNMELSLSITMTTISSLVAMFMLPLNLFIYLETLSGRKAVINWMDLCSTLAIVVTAVSLGLLANHKIPKYVNIFNAFGQLAGLTLIIWTLVHANTNTSSPIWNRSWEVYFLTFFPCCVGILYGVGVASCLKMHKPEVSAIGIEICFQNTAIAIVFATAMYSGEESRLALGIPILYCMGNGIVGITSAIIFWKLGWSFAPKNENICKVIGKNYQPKREDEEMSKENKESPEDNPKKPVQGEISLETGDSHTREPITQDMAYV